MFTSTKEKKLYGSGSVQLRHNWCSEMLSVLAVLGRPGPGPGGYQPCRSPQQQQGSMTQQKCYIWSWYFKWITRSSSFFPFNVSCWIPFVCLALVVVGCWWFLVGNNRTTEQTCESCCDKLAVGAHSAHKEETTQMQQLSKLLCSSRPLSLNSCAECSNTKQYLESWTLGPPG